MYSRQHTPLLYLPALLIAIGLLYPAAARAQNKSDTLHVVHIKSRHVLSPDIRLDGYAAGQKVSPIDSAALQQYRMQSIATLLSQQVPVFVKAYSFNGLATLSFRGASAAQSQVLWNGVPVQNAALGIADVAALPVMLMHKVNIVYGGSGALYGSGNVGGALLLESDKPVFDSGYRRASVSAGMGSFGQYSGGLTGSMAGKRWYLSANAFAQAARNNYAYTDAGGNRQKMPNGRLQSGSAIVTAAYQPNVRNTFSLSAWYQQYSRQIPPALFEQYSVKEQQDNTLRLVSAWQHNKGQHSLYARTSLIQDKTAYNDSAVQLATAYTVLQYYQEVGWEQLLGRYGKLLLFSPIQLSWLPNGSDTQYQHRVAIATAYHISLLGQRLSIAAQARAENINAHNIFLPGGGASYQVTDWLALRANVQRTYRMPTLNELYYFPGGNSQLRPERGWSQDAGYTIKATVSCFTLYHDATVYNRNINDWILWLGGAVWTPHNIATVHSRGIETDNKVTYTIGKWQLHAGIATAYTIATTTASYLPYDGSIGKQIPYTPRYNGRLNIGFTFHRLSASYNHSYTGYRFITTDESSWLQPYHLGGLQAMYTTAWHSRQLQFTAQCSNIWNQHYSVAGFRPMPGTNWLAGCRLQLR